MTELAREAIATYLVGPVDDDGGRDLSFFAIGEADVTDAAENVDSYVAEAIEQRFRDDRR